MPTLYYSTPFGRGASIRLIPRSRAGHRAKAEIANQAVASVRNDVLPINKWTRKAFLEMFHSQAPKIECTAPIVYIEAV